MLNTVSTVYPLVGLTSLNIMLEVIFHFTAIFRFSSAFVFKSDSCCSGASLWGFSFCKDHFSNWNYAKLFLPKKSTKE